MKQGIQELRRKYDLVPADKAVNNFAVVCRLHFINTLKQEQWYSPKHRSYIPSISHGAAKGSVEQRYKAYEEASTDEKTVINSHSNELPYKIINGRLRECHNKIT